MTHRRGATGSSTQLQQLPGGNGIVHPQQKLKTRYCDSCHHAQRAHQTQNDGSTKCSAGCPCKRFLG